MNRRTFVKGGLTMAAAPMILTRGRGLPSDEVRLAAIGVRNQGGWDLEQALKAPGVQCAAVCDVSDEALASRMPAIERRTGKKPPVVHDFRRVLDDASIDAVIIGTPDHWHAVMATMAMEAGKDVYIEKPLANSIYEAQAIRKAAARYNRVVAVGQQQRTGKHFGDVVRFIREGRLGKIRQIRAWGNFDYGRGGDPVPDSNPPPGLDFDMWLGPAPVVPFNATHVRHWRFRWAYGGGLMTDWGVHLMDIVLWAMDVRGAPKWVSAAGGILAYPERAMQTPDTLAVTYAFDDFVVTWEHTGGVQNGPFGRHYGIAFTGNEGILVVDRDGWEVLPHRVSGTDTYRIPVHRVTGGNDGHQEHLANFIDCVRTRRVPNAPVEAGELAAFYSHMGNIAWRTNTRLEWDAAANRFRDNPEADQFLMPVYRAPWKLSGQDVG